MHLYDKNQWSLQQEKAEVTVSEVASHLRASGGSLVPDTLMELREAALLKKCLNEGGTSLPFLQERPEREVEEEKEEEEEDDKRMTNSATSKHRLNNAGL